MSAHEYRYVGAPHNSVWEVWPGAAPTAGMSITGGHGGVARRLQPRDLGLCNYVKGWPLDLAPVVPLLYVKLLGVA